MSLVKTEQATESEKVEQPGPKEKGCEFRITIYEAWCKKCGICVSFCPKEVLASDRMGAPKVVHPERCIACGQCVLHCPDFAIALASADDARIGKRRADKTGEKSPEASSDKNAEGKK